jgi:hypothetical protein
VAALASTKKILSRYLFTKGGCGDQPAAATAMTTPHPLASHVEIDALLATLAEPRPWPAPERLVRAWRALLDDLRGARSGELRAALAELLALSPAGLDAAFDAMVATVATDACLELLAAPRDPHPGPPAVIVLASTPPGLALQTLLPALAARRAILFKSSSAERMATPWIVDALTRHEPELASRVAAVHWPGGEREIEERLLASTGRWIAYGGAQALASLAARCPPERWVGQGPKLSLAVLGADVDPAEVAAALAEDAALLDQRGCLSLQTVITLGDPHALASALGAALAAAALRWPPGAAGAAALAEVRLLREDAELRGLAVADLPLRQGTVVVEADGAPLQPSPGLRTVRVHGVGSADEVWSLLAPWRSSLQGVAVVGELGALPATLAAWGVGWLCAPGRLQCPDVATWANGGTTAFEILSAR